MSCHCCILILVIVVLFCPWLGNLTKVQLKERPYIVSITNRLSIHQCDGTIISTWHVISSCFCFSADVGEWQYIMDPGKFQVIAGMIQHDQINDIYVQTREVKNLIAHPKCQKVEQGAIYDFGLIVVQQPFLLTEYVLPANLGFYEENCHFSNVIDSIVSNKSSCVVVSWFSTNKSEPYVFEDTLSISSCVGKTENIENRFNCSICYFCTPVSEHLGCSKKLNGAPIFCNNFFTGVFIHFQHCVEKSNYYFGRVDSMMNWIGNIVTLGKTWRSIPSLSIMALTFALSFLTNIYM